MYKKMFRIVYVTKSVREVKKVKYILNDGFAVYSCHGITEWNTTIRKKDPDVTLLDLDSFETIDKGIWILERIHTLPDAPLVIPVSDCNDTAVVVSCVQKGAWDYIHRPYTKEKLRSIVQRCVSYRSRCRSALYESEDVFESFIGNSRAIQTVKRKIVRYGKSNSPILIAGESGTGKEIVARLIHNISSRAKNIYLSQNCAAMPDTLVSAEIFGSEKGAFTDAVSKPGCFERAHTGTLFLDEIGDMSSTFQVKLLRVLEQGELTRVGGIKPIYIDTRVVCATNKNLNHLVYSGVFRQDLFYRINMLPITLPPLRDRKMDIPQLVTHFLNQYCTRPIRVQSNAIDKLMGHRWPGNVRELRNVIERGVLLSSGAHITADDIHLYFG